MNDFYQFASNSPFLTFFLFMIIGETIIKTANAIFGGCKEKKKPMIAEDK